MKGQLTACPTYVIAATYLGDIHWCQRATIRDWLYKVSYVNTFESSSVRSDKTWRQGLGASLFVVLWICP